MKPVIPTDVYMARRATRQAQRPVPRTAPRVRRVPPRATLIVHGGDGRAHCGPRRFPVTTDSSAVTCAMCLSIMETL